MRPTILHKNRWAQVDLRCHRLTIVTKNVSKWGNNLPARETMACDVSIGSVLPCSTSIKYTNSAHISSVPQKREKRVHMGQKPSSLRVETAMQAGLCHSLEWQTLSTATACKVARLFIGLFNYPPCHRSILSNLQKS